MPWAGKPTRTRSSPSWTSIYISTFIRTPLTVAGGAARSKTCDPIQRQHRQAQRAGSQHGPRPGARCHHQRRPCSQKIFKPAPEAYRLIESTLRVPPAEVLFVSSNPWDACGAKAFRLERRLDRAGDAGGDGAGMCQKRRRRPAHDVQGDPHPDGVDSDLSLNYRIHRAIGTARSWSPPMSLESRSARFFRRACARYRRHRNRRSVRRRWRWRAEAYASSPAESRNNAVASDRRARGADRGQRRPRGWTTRRSRRISAASRRCWTSTRSPRLRGHDSAAYARSALKNPRCRLYCDVSLKAFDEVVPRRARPTARSASRLRDG